MPRYINTSCWVHLVSLVCLTSGLTIGTGESRRGLVPGGGCFSCSLHSLTSRISLCHFSFFLCFFLHSSFHVLLWDCVPYILFIACMMVGMGLLTKANQQRLQQWRIRLLLPQHALASPPLQSQFLAIADKHQIRTNCGKIQSQASCYIFWWKNTNRSFKRSKTMSTMTFLLPKL